MRQILVFHWTIKTTGNWFLNEVTVLSFDLSLPPLRFLTYGFLATDSLRLTAFFELLCHRQSSLLATRSFLFSPCTNFGLTDFCHPQRRSNLFFLICCNFWPERILMFCFASIQLRPISDYDMLTVKRSARDLLCKKIVSQQRGAKQKLLYCGLTESRYLLEKLQGL